MRRKYKKTKQNKNNIKSHKRQEDKLHENQTNN